MSAHAAKWARKQHLNLGDRSVLMELAFEADREGSCELDPESIRVRTGVGEAALFRAIASLAAKGLLTGPRWNAGRGWVGTNVQLAIEQSHLRAVNGVGRAA